MASEIRVNKINNRAGLGTITIADTGVVVNGIVTCTEVSGLNVLNIAGVSTFASTLDINGDIDVDGHTNLDNVNVAGVATFAGEVRTGTGSTVGIGSTAYVHKIAFKEAGSVNSTLTAALGNNGGSLTFTGGGVQNGFWGNGGLKIAGSGASATSGPEANCTLEVVSSQNTRVLFKGSANTGLDFDSSSPNNGVANYIRSDKDLIFYTGYGSSGLSTNFKIGEKEGSTFYSSVGIRTNYYPLGAVSISMDAISGIVTASSFRGDGSQLTGISAGPGTGESYVILRNQSNPPALSNTGRNIIIGVGAAHKYGNGSATGGNENLFAGYNAGYTQTGGDGNVFLGAGAGYSNATSTGNVYVGQEAGRFATGQDNICIGRFAGNVGGFTGSNNLVFGYNSDPSSANVSNEITLGNANISLLRVPGINLTFGNNGAVIAGVVTATSFSGDGSSLSNLPAGAPVGGASTNTVFFENDTAVAVNYQVTSGKNAMSAGPIAINAGIAVTVPSGSSWTIV